MKKAFFLFAFISFFNSSFGQDSKNKIEINTHPSDHFLIQFSSDHWTAAPDSIQSRIKSVSRGANFYFMIDKSFASNKHFSVAFGGGIGTSSIFFNKLGVGINGTKSVLSFDKLDSTNHFKKYKLTTCFLELPVEMRFSSNPANPDKSIKGAIGVKVGTLINAHSKGKTLQNASDNTINEFTEKTSSKSYFNTTRVMATARLGYGNFSLFGAYNLNTMFKDKVAANMKLLQLGLTISGL
jgi:hypothetical protein